MKKTDEISKPVPAQEIPPITALPVPGSPIANDQVNFDLEPDFTKDGNAAKYEVQAESLCMAQAKDFISKDTNFGRAQKHRDRALRPLVRHLALLKAVKLGRGGRGSQWGDTVQKFDGLVLRSVNRWIAAAVCEGHLPSWAVMRLKATAKKKPKKKPAKIELTPPSIQERDQILAAMDRLRMKSGSEGLWQVIFDAVTQHADAQESENVSSVAPLEENDTWVGPPPVLSHMASSKPRQWEGLDV